MSPEPPPPEVISRLPFDLAGYRLVPWMERPDRDMLFTDRVGPWFDGDGSEIVLPCTEPFDEAVDKIVRRWTARSNLAGLEDQTLEIGFPEVTLLAQYEWDRVVDDQAPAPRYGFLLQLNGAQATLGRVCEQLIVGVLFDRYSHLAWPASRMLGTVDAAEAGYLDQPVSGSRTDDVVLLEGGRPTALIEVKATGRGWAAIRRPVRTTALRQLWATRDANPTLELDLLVIAASLTDRQIGIFRPPADRETAALEWCAAHTLWRPPPLSMMSTCQDGRPARGLLCGPRRTRAGGSLTSTARILDERSRLECQRDDIEHPDGTPPRRETRRRSRRAAPSHAVEG